MARHQEPKPARDRPRLAASRPLARAGIAAILLVCALAAFASPAAEAAFGIKSFVFAACREGATCSPESLRAAEAAHEFPREAFMQAAGRPNTLVGYLRIHSTMEPPREGEREREVPEGSLERVRVDLPAGVSINPRALEQCEQTKFSEEQCPAGSKVGQIQLVDTGPSYTGHFPIYNLVPPAGTPVELGVIVAGFPTTIVGGVSWHSEPALAERGIASGNYHEYAEFQVPPLGVIEARLKLEGQAGTGFITMPSECDGPLFASAWADSREAQSSEALSEAFTPVPFAAEQCAQVPFAPSFLVTPETTQSEAPDGLTVEAQVPQNSNHSEVNSSTLKRTEVTLPEGMTLNPAAAVGLEACSDEQFARVSGAAVTCPPSSVVGDVEIQTPLLAQTPQLAAEPLTGNIYIGQPLSSEPQSGQQYRLFIDAEAPRAGLAVRLEGRVAANPGSGQLVATIPETPPLQFSAVVLRFHGGAHGLLANPLACGTATTNAVLFPDSGGPNATPFSSALFGADGEGRCAPGTPPFALTQATEESSDAAGEHASFTLTLAREPGQQYLDGLTTRLPEGLLADLSAVPLCPEAQAEQGSCPEASEIGVATVTAGAGAAVLEVPGVVYLAGPFDGAPYSLAVALPAAHIGPYDDGIVVVRAGIGIDPHTARLSVLSASPGSPGALPTMVAGVALHLRSLSIEINRAGFLVNPTSCSPLATESTLTGTTALPPGAGAAAAEALSTPLAIAGCQSLPFRPSFSAQAAAHATRLEGAGLALTLATGPHQANLQEVRVQLPRELAARVGTLQKACTEAQALSDILACPQAARVAAGALTTPLLPGTLSGPGILVSHGGAAFPDLDFVLQGDGITLIVVGNTEIRNGILSSTFSAMPDAPLTSFTATFPTGHNALFSANGSLCTRTYTTTSRVRVQRHGHPPGAGGHRRYRLLTVTHTAALVPAMPTTMVAQNGATVTQVTPVAVSGCPVAVGPLRLLGRSARGHSARVTLLAPAPGRLAVRGHGVRNSGRRLTHAGRVQLSVGLTPAGLRTLRRHRRLRLRVTLTFTPAGAATASSRVATMLTFRR